MGNYHNSSATNTTQRKASQSSSSDDEKKKKPPPPTGPPSIRYQVLYDRNYQSLRVTVIQCKVHSFLVFNLIENLNTGFEKRWTP